MEISRRSAPGPAAERRFRVRNLTKDTLLCEAASLAGTFWKRAKGLMFQSEWSDCDGLLLSPCRSIHTFGMRMRIDVCFLDASFGITRSFPSLGPWRAAHGGRGSRATLELPAGVLERTRTGAGDCLALERAEVCGAPAATCMRVEDADHGSVHDRGRA